MAYMRGEYYVWGDGENIHINAETMPSMIFEELAAMVFLRMTEQEREAAILRAYENHGGNFGCEGVAKYLGKPSAYDEVKRSVERYQESS